MRGYFMAAAMAAAPGTVISMPANAAEPSNTDLVACLSSTATDLSSSIAACDRLQQAGGLTAEDLSEVIIARSSRLLKARDFELAMEDAEVAVVVAPLTKRARALTQRARVHDGQGNASAAMIDADAAYALDPDDDFVVRVFAALAAENGRHHEALRIYDRVLEKTPSFEMLGAACWVRATRNTELEQAREHCQRGMMFEPQRSDLLESAGMLALRVGDWELAHRLHDLAVQANPASYAGLYGRGLASLALGAVDSAREDFARAIRIDARVAKRFEGYGMSPAQILAAAGSARADPPAPAKGPFAVVAARAHAIPSGMKITAPSFTIPSGDHHGYWNTFLIAGRKGDSYLVTYEGPDGNAFDAGLPLDTGPGLRVTRSTSNLMFGIPESVVTLEQDGVHRLQIRQADTIRGSDGHTVPRPFAPYQLLFARN
jgi:tetratricopeptide (TPR) repeat protein